MISENWKKYAIIGGCAALGALLISVTLLFGSHLINSQPDYSNITVQPLDVVEVSYSTPVSGKILTREEFTTLQEAGLMTNFETYENYAATAVAAEMTIKTSDITAAGVNAELYDIVSQYFNVWYGSMRVSPILPMAISNVETPGRADHNVTWCSLFPSRIVPIEYLHDFDVTSVISNPDWFKALSSEWSTRDRGCLQMSPTYGTNNETLNGQMSGTEKEKLSLVDTSGYSGWVSGASSSPGDRFYLPDVCLRITAAFQLQTINMQKNNYAPTTDLQLVAMLAASHQQSGVWTYSNHSKGVGCWRSGELAYEWCRTASSEPVINALTSIAASTDSCFIDTSRAESLCRELGINDYSKYSTKSIVCTYVIKVLYAYVKLCMLYTQ